ncbi:ABHD11-like protein isoform X2, partial [Tanacetum coccineum]
MINKDKNEFQHIYSVTTHQYHILSFNMAVIAYRDGTRALFDQFTSSSSLSSVSTFTIILIHGLLGCGNDFADFAHSLAQNLSASHASADWRMITVDLRNHGRSTNIEGLLPPHDLKNTARDIANLAKYLDIWPDVVVGHSLGGKVVLQYALSSAQGDYGDSTQLPKQVWVLDCGPGAYEGGYGTEEALYSLKTLPTPIPSKEWLADYIINLGFPKFKADWICSSLKKSGEQWLLSFNVDVSKLDWNVSHHKDEGNSCER